MIGKRVWWRKVYNSRRKCPQTSTGTEKVNLNCLRTILLTYLTWIRRWLIPDQITRACMKEWQMLEIGKMNSTIQWTSMMLSKIGWIDSPVRGLASFSNLFNNLSFQHSSRVLRILSILRSLKWIGTFLTSGHKLTRAIEVNWRDVTLSLAQTPSQILWDILRLQRQAPVTY